jgi:molybdenum cofactor sulfurtransferase
MIDLDQAKSLTIIDDDYFNELRKVEYGNLDSQKQVYLDYTGGNLYSKSQVLKHQNLLLQNILGNPHSTNPTSQKSTELVESARSKILQFFNAHDYTCVFTQNASGSLKIVGESYPFNERSKLLLLSDNHNSVNGIREYCRSKNGETKYVPLNYEDLQINEKYLTESLSEPTEGDTNLFAFPAQSNVSGVKHDLKWIEYAQKRNYDVLLDAAAFVPTTKLDLSIYKPDYVTISFYKIFGYPTGIGCLLIKNSSYSKLAKPWFAGGTVTLVSVASQNKFLANGHERFEDGTLNYNNIPAVEIGLDYIESIGIERISARVKSLIQYLANGLKALHHDNGRPIVKVFGPESFDNRGGNIIMNFFDPNEKAYSFNEIENLTNDQLISIRSGCFCNPGIDEINNCITNEEISKYFMTRDNGDYYDMIAFLGKMRGATRVSVGLATSKKDLDKFIELTRSLKNKNCSK